jgi:hypothetical protein
MSEQAMKQLFCQISKVDVEKRTVTGIGTSEAIDAEGEIVDYESSKPYIEAWSAAAIARSQGKSYGNVREMHQSWAAGKLSEPIVFDDANKAVIITSYISDDDAWDKCLDGTYTGFSICGPIVGEKWADPNNLGVKRFTCAPIEFSVCDLPCNPAAVFTAVKAGGVTEERKFKRPGSGEKEPTVAKTAIAQKSMYNIADLSSLISSLRWTQEDLVYERESEGDNSAVPDKLKSAIVALCDVLVDLAREESSELISAMKATGAKRLAAKAAAAAEPEPAAVEPPAADAGTGSEAEASGKAAGAPQSQGASPETGEHTPMDEAQKAQLAAAEKNAAESLELAKKNNEAISSLGEAFTKGFEGLANLLTAQPQAAKSAGAGVVKTVAKEGDNGGQAAATTAAVDSKDPVVIAKSIIASGGRPVERGEALNIGR